MLNLKKTEYQENNLVKISGRFEEAKEYVEFRVKHKKVFFVAQQSKYGWNVFMRHVNHTKLIHIGLSKDEAIYSAEQECLKSA